MLKSFPKIALIIIFGVSSFLIVTAIQQYQLPDQSNDDFKTQSFSDQIFSKCGGDDPHCIVTEIEDLSEEQDKETVILTMQEIFVKVKDSSEFCHSFAHHVGEFTFAYVGDFKEALSYVDPRLCGGAMQHGIIENYMKSLAFFNKNDPEMVDVSIICPNIPENPQSIERWECLHGVGHGLATIYDYDTINAIQRCGEFLESWEQTSCSKGLFMENFSEAAKDRQADVKEDDWFYPCNVVDKKFAPGCYHYQVSYMLGKMSDAGLAQEECKKIDNEFIQYCFRGMGRAMATVLGYDLETAEIICQNKGIPKQHQSNCYLGMAMVFSDNKNTSVALEFCKSIPDQFQSECFSEVGKWIKLVYPSNQEREDECVKANNEDHAKNCLDASLDNIRIL